MLFFVFLHLDCPAVRIYVIYIYIYIGSDMWKMCVCACVCMCVNVCVNIHICIHRVRYEDRCGHTDGKLAGQGR